MPGFTVIVVAMLRRLLATASSAALPIVLNGLEGLPGFESEPEAPSTKTLCSMARAPSVSATGPFSFGGRVGAFGDESTANAPRHIPKSRKTSMQPQTRRFIAPSFQLSYAP